MDAAERKRLKLGNLKMSKEAWGALTDKGRQEPGSSLEYTIRRALASDSRDREHEQLLSDPSVRSVEVVAWNPCTAAETLRATTPFMPKSVAPDFPLPGCTRAVCECRLTRHWQSDEVDFLRRQASDDLTAEHTVDADYGFSEPPKPDVIPAPRSKTLDAIKTVLAVIGALALIFLILKLR